VQGSALALAVSNAGGMGSLPCVFLSLETMRNEIAAVAAGTSNPYNVNFVCHTPPQPDPEREKAWRNVLRSMPPEEGAQFRGSALQS